MLIHRERYQCTKLFQAEVQLTSQILFSRLRVLSTEQSPVWCYSGFGNAFQELELVRLYPCAPSQQWFYCYKLNLFSNYFNSEIQLYIRMLTHLWYTSSCAKARNRSGWGLKCSCITNKCFHKGIALCIRNIYGFELIYGQVHNVCETRDVVGVGCFGLFVCFLVFFV